MGNDSHLFTLTLAVDGRGRYKAGNYPGRKVNSATSDASLENTPNRDRRVTIGSTSTVYKDIWPNNLPSLHRYSARVKMALPGTETVRFRRPTTGPNAPTPKEVKKDEFGSLAPEGWKRRHQGILQDQVGRSVHADREQPDFCLNDIIGNRMDHSSPASRSLFGYCSSSERLEQCIISFPTATRVSET